MFRLMLKNRRVKKNNQFHYSSPLLIPGLAILLIFLTLNVFNLSRQPSVLGITTSRWWPFSFLKKELVEDKIEAKKRFSDLPYDIKVDLDKIYSQSSIKSGIYWRMSQVSRKATTTIMAANFINQINGGILAAMQGGKEAVADWIAEELAKKLASDIIAEQTTEKKAEFTLVLYDVAKLDYAIVSKGFKAVVNAGDLQVQAASWVLQAEMDYINKNLSQGYQKLASIDLWTGTKPLEVYIIGVEGENKNTGLYDKGVKFYYFDYSKNKYLDYFDDVVAIKIEKVKSEETPKETTAVGGCQKINLSEGYKTYFFYKSVSPCASYSRSVTASRFSVRCNQASAQWREHYIKEVSTQGASKLKIKATLGLIDYAHFFGTGVKSDDYVDLIALSTDPNPTFQGECNKSVSEADWPKCGLSSSHPSSLGHCGVPKNSESKYCDFEINISGKSKIWLALRVADAWLADVEGSLTNLEICPQ